ncbi:MAG: BON domain-containing protein [Terriglobales bacterium]
MRRTMAVVGLTMGLLIASAAGAAPPPPQAASATHALDQQIQHYLRQQYSGNKSLAHVATTVSDRVVTLRGSVPDYRADLQAAHIARQVGSVNGVINLLKVNAPYVPDATLRKQLAERLTYDRMGEGQVFNNLTLHVHDGVVTVGGNVHDYASRDSALDIVDNTKGVRGVRDHVKVAPTSTFDDQIRFRVARAIYGNPALRRYALNPAHPIRIVVNNGHVTLDGVVASNLDKTLADHAARAVPNVFSVQDNLVVASGK